MNGYRNGFMLIEPIPMVLHLPFTIRFTISQLDVYPLAHHGCAEGHCRCLGTGGGATTMAGEWPMVAAMVKFTVSSGWFMMILTT